MEHEEQSGNADADAFIEAAIRLGARNGVAALDADQRLVFLISEAEVDCAMNGIDTFLNRYCPDWMAETADAFEAVGAAELAAALRVITPATERDDPLLDRANDLINDHAGWDYDTIRAEIVRRLAGRAAKAGS